MGCTDHHGQSKTERELDELIRERGYIKELAPQPDTCLRCGSKVDYFKWDEHDTFHQRTDPIFEVKGGYGVYSKHYLSRQS